MHERTAARRTTCLAALTCALFVVLASCTDAQRSNLSSAVGSVSLPSRPEPTSEPGIATTAPVPTDSQTDTQTETETETHTETETETQTETQTRTQTETRTDTQTQTQTETRTHTQTQTETATQSPSVTDQAQGPPADGSDEGGSFPWWLVILVALIAGGAVFAGRRAAGRRAKEAWSTSVGQAATDAAALGGVVDEWLSSAPAGVPPQPPPGLAGQADRLDERLAGMELAAPEETARTQITRLRASLTDLRASLTLGQAADRGELAERLSTFRAETRTLQARTTPTTTGGSSPSPGSGF